MEKFISMQRTRNGFVVLVAWMLSSTSGFGQLQTVFSDYGGATFLTRINTAASSFTGLGASYFDATDAGLIQAQIQSDLQTIYQKFSINFVTTNPGGSFHTIQFFNTDPSNFGLAPFDWRNQVAAETVNVFPANFSNGNLPGLLDSSLSKAVNRQRLATALAGTAAHELAHSFGLDHQDAYGTPAMTNQAATGGVQNQHVMRTGSTGASTAERLQRPHFNPLEVAKLEVTGNLVVNGFAPVAEQAAAHGTNATAQAVTLSALNYNNVMAAVVNQASISAVNEVDAYRFTFKPNDLISLAVINENPVPNPRVNPFLRLFDTDGTTVLLSNSDTRFSGNSFGQPGDPVYVNGSILLNFFTASGGDYFVQVLGEGAANTGNYELFVMAQSVPEPATLALLGVSLSATGYIWYRRRRHHRKALEATIRV